MCPSVLDVTRLQAILYILGKRGITITASSRGAVQPSAVVCADPLEEAGKSTLYAICKQYMVCFPVTLISV